MKKGDKKFQTLSPFLKSEWNILTNIYLHTIKEDLPWQLLHKW